MKQTILIFSIATLMISCSNNKESEALQQQKITIDSMKAEAGKQRIIDSMNLVATQPSAVNNEAAAVAAANHTAPTHKTHNGTGKSGGNTYNSTTTTTTNNTTTAQPVATTGQKKKGWTGAVKGAVIGAGAGAITGAMVDKKKGEGAIVGGILGAGTGAGVGALLDKHKRNKEEQAKQDANK